MKYCFITFRSVTWAQRGEQALQKEGIRCTLLRTPKWMEEQGCGYCLRLHSSRTAEAVACLNKEKISMRKVYAQTADGRLEEWRP